MDRNQKQAAAFERFMEQVNENMETCKHGHSGCAAVPNGRCSDEAYLALPFAVQVLVDNS